MTNKKIPIITIIYSNTLIETRCCFLLAPTLFYFQRSKNRKKNFIKKSINRTSRIKRTSKNIQLLLSK